MQYSLISKDNIVLDFYDTREEAEAKKELHAGSVVVPKEEFYKKGLDLNNLKILSNKEKIERGLIKLEENQVFIESSDYIVTLSPTQKYENGEIKEKTLIELYTTGVIGDEEYNQAVLEKRVEYYKNELDPAFIEVLQKYMATVDDMPEDLKTQFDALMKDKQAMKEYYPKTTNVDFNKLVERQVQNLQAGGIDENIR